MEMLAQTRVAGRTRGLGAYVLCLADFGQSQCNQLLAQVLMHSGQQPRFRET